MMEVCSLRALQQPSLSQTTSAKQSLRLAARAVNHRREATGSVRWPQGSEQRDKTENDWISGDASGGSGLVEHTKHLTQADYSESIGWAFDFHHKAHTIIMATA